MSKNSNPSGKGSHPGLTGNKGFVKKFGKGSATKCAKSSSSGFKLSKSRTSNGSKSNSSKCSGKRVGFKLFGINVGLKLPAPKSGSSSSKASKSSKCKASGMTKLCSSKSRSKSNRKSQTTTTITKSGRSKSKSTTKSCGKNQSKGSIKSKSRSKNASKEEVKGMSRSVDNDGWEYVYMWNYEDGTTQPANVPEENQNQILTVQPGTAGANAVGSSVIVAPNSAPPQSGIAATPSQIPAGQDQILAVGSVQSQTPALAPVLSPSPALTPAPVLAPSPAPILAPAPVPSAIPSTGITTQLGPSNSNLNQQQ